MENNKDLVKQLLQTAFNERNVMAAAELLAERYIQHNPNVPTGKVGFLPWWYLPYSLASD